MSCIRTKNLVIYLSILILAGCASGSAIVTGKTRTPLQPTDVELYIVPPANYEVIGIVKASSDAGWTEQSSVDYAVEELKKQAAKLGANGVLLQSSGQNTRSGIGTVSNYRTGQSSFYTFGVTEQLVQGKAILVKP